MKYLMKRWIDGQVGMSGNIIIEVTEQSMIRHFEKEMDGYCTQNNGDCSTCSLCNYGRDCQNRPIVDFSPATLKKIELFEAHK